MRSRNIQKLVLGFAMLLMSLSSFGQYSVAREWNEALLHSIRLDFARPTVHARNLFHSSALMYDMWAVFDPVAEPYFLGKTVHGFYIDFQGFSSQSIESDRHKAISYGMFRLLSHRFANSPNPDETFQYLEDLMEDFGYDIDYTSSDYTSGDARALGNYIAERIIEYGLQDGSNEVKQYENVFYEPTNEPILPDFPGNPDITDPNRWQPIILDVYIDQSGNVIVGGGSPFLGPEWGAVLPFSLTEEDLTIHERDGNEYWVYHDPGVPPLLDTINGGKSSDNYRWSFSLVSCWSAHLDANDGVLWDISPGSIGNLTSYPTTFDDHPGFYDLINGGDNSTGHDLNPVTGEPYEPQMVPRGDYARVLAEFWADGPDSETPPGHWFTLLNHVSDHPMLEKKFAGQGEELDDLEWDVKSYFMLGGAMHDAAIVAWGIKGYYDYIRPVSAIRFMADQGQSSNESDGNYDKNGIGLIADFIEKVEEGDPLAGSENENIGKIKVRAWKGPDYIDDPYRDEAGVDWILAENWWPYQRPTFVTPPFAGYISGHSTYSRTAAEVLTQLTGDPFFPGGMGEFHAAKDEFLVFEDGPSVDLTLQWATYRDASDQCSLSRIWGGIHPPADDIPGRLIGIELGPEAFDFASQYFDGTVLAVEEAESSSELLPFPNPASDFLKVNFMHGHEYKIWITNLQGKELYAGDVSNEPHLELDVRGWPTGIYIISIEINGRLVSKKFRKY
ncbi:MAG: T9SS type A sorting domain-containing protein [Cyclobacteriaceae bacterium]